MIRWAPPTSAEVLDALDVTWSALERRPLGPWVLRRGGGGGSRASSVQPRGAAPEDIDAALTAAKAQNAAWGQPTIVQLGEEDAALDAALAARGWPITDSNVILATSIGALPRQLHGDITAVRVSAPLASLEALWDVGGIGPARRAIMAAVATPKISLLMRAGDRPAAAAFVARHGSIAVLSALFVSPERRRSGVGAAALAAAADWALEAGAQTLALAVGEKNAGARALYDRLGFRPVCGYHYRRAPEDPA